MTVQHAATMREFDRLFDNPALYPLDLDLAHGRIRFMHLTETCYDESPFLDVRLRRPGGGEFELELARLVELYGRVRPPRRPMFWLFHIGHCGSTLLSRMLGSLGGVLVVREPPPLLELARRRPPRQLKNATRWRDSFVLILSLLSRTFDRQDIALVKPNSHANSLIGHMLDWHPDTRALMLYIGLEPWLATMLRTHTRPEIQHAVDRYRMADFRLLTDVEEHLELDDARRAALIWLVQMYEMTQAAAVYPYRVRIMNFDRILEDTRAALAHLAGFLGLPTDGTRVSLALDLSTRHAKFVDEPYDVRSRQHMLDEARREFAQEIRDGLAWAQQACERHAALGSLPHDPLGAGRAQATAASQPDPG
ncbi:hypothetical protein BH24PSE2_BH24PSE2_10870 [soil metagenome]